MTAKKRQRAQTSRSKPSPWVFILPVVAAAAILLVVFLTRQGSAPSGSSSSAPLPLEISVAQAAQKRDAGAFMLDVREPDEWEAVHMPGATLIPLGQLESRLSEVPKDKEVVVVCRSGNRSQSGRDILLKAGFSQVTSMAGGMNDWKSSGFPTVSGP